MATKKHADNPSLFAMEPQEKKEAESINAPLAARMRPRTLEEVVGQSHLLAEGKLLRRTIQSDRWTSVIFYGPPGCGKTTLAQVISNVTGARFVSLNAVSSNVSEIRKVLDSARDWNRQQKKTILFIDEIHRFNKAQQDVLMPDVERGTLVLIGATTQNPSFAINGPLLSRSTVFELKPVDENDLNILLKRAIQDSDRGFGKLNIQASPEALVHLSKMASGDARKALNSLEVAAMTTPPSTEGIILIDQKVAEESCQRRVVHYDHDGDYHYDTISAFIKSMRGSDPDSAVYWLAKMLYAGEDPRFIIRRILILASEDIGNADPQALILASSGLQAIEFVGLPEAQIILSQLVTYMALAPKSNASYKAISMAMEDVKNEGAQEVPQHLRDGHYKGAEKLGHGKGYHYSHDVRGVDTQKFRPGQKAYYHPKDASGFERELAKKLTYLKSQRSQ